MLSPKKMGKKIAIICGHYIKSLGEENQRERAFIVNGGSLSK